jgi:hypothetical protein
MTAEPMRMAVDSLIVDNQFKPPHDEVFDTLFGLAMQGDLMVYFAAVPLRLIKPFSKEFKVASIPNGQQIIDSIFEEAVRGKHQQIWVYEKGDHFVMSDDYLIYEACLRGQPDFVGCWVLGRPRNPLAKQVQGPVDARQVAGFSS